LVASLIYELNATSSRKEATAVAVS
jgi:hypothetical protein